MLKEILQYFWGKMDIHSHYEFALLEEYDVTATTLQSVPCLYSQAGCYRAERSTETLRLNISFSVLLRYYNSYGRKEILEPVFKSHFCETAKSSSKAEKLEFNFISAQKEFIFEVDNSGLILV